jgi:pilus assembly protein CpaE
MVQSIQKFLMFERDIKVVGVAGSGQDAKVKAQALKPDVILMDINLRDIDGLTVTKEITTTLGSRVVMMSVHNEPEYYGRAMLVGARGYLAKPFSQEELVTTIRAATEFPVQASGPPRRPRDPDTPQRLQHIIAMFSPKGGVGRSVLAANLAIEIRHHTNARVVLVDCNLQGGDAHVLLNVNTSNSIDDLRESGSLDQEIVEAAVAVHEGSGVNVLRAPVSPESAELFTGDAMRAILVELREHFDYLIVDTDVTFSEATLTVLEMADVILVPTTLEVTTINRVAQFLDVMDRLGFPRAKVKLVCNRVDSIYGIKPQLVQARLGIKFMALIPEDARLVVSSVNRGVPFTLSSKSAMVTKSMQNLAERVVSLLSSPTGGPPPEKRRWGLR